MELQVERRLDAVRLRDAVLVAMDRHPRAWARLVPASGWRHRHVWEIPPAPDLDHYDAVTCADDSALAAARAEIEDGPVRLTSSPPLRVRLAHHPSGDVIILNLHHAAGDGMSALALLRSVARAYARRDDLDLDTGPERIGFAGGHKGRARALVELGRAARQSVHVVPDGGDDRAGYGYHHRTLSATETAGLVQRSRLAGVTVNDVLLAALHLTIASWNAGHGAQGGRQSVLMPMNLRPKGQADHVVGNFSLMVPVVTAELERTTPAAALAAVATRTARFKESGAPAMLVRVLRVLQHVPAPAKRGIADFVASPRRAPTALLSNLGRVDDRFDFGPDGGAATGLWFTPPIKMPAGLALGVITASGRLHLGFRYRHPLLGAAQVDELASRYVDAVAAVGVGGGP